MAYMQALNRTIHVTILLGDAEGITFQITHLLDDALANGLHIHVDQRFNIVTHDPVAIVMYMKTMK